MIWQLSRFSFLMYEEEGTARAYHRDDYRKLIALDFFSDVLLVMMRMDELTKRRNDG